MKQIEIFQDKCVGCRLCEFVCSLAHDGECSTSGSRIRVYRDEEFGNNRVSTCLQCAEPECIEACPSGALSRDPVRGVIADPDLCIACEACAAACPMSAIHFNSESGRSFKCDLCNGNPECAQVCSRQALVVTEVNSGHSPAEVARLSAEYHSRPVPEGPNLKSPFSWEKGGQAS